MLACLDQYLKQCMYQLWKKRSLNALQHAQREREKNHFVQYQKVLLKILLDLILYPIFVCTMYSYTCVVNLATF